MSPLHRFTRSLLLIAFALLVCTVTYWLTRPVLAGLAGRSEWLTTSLLTRIGFLIQAGAAVTALALLRRGPPLADLLALHLKTTLALSLIAAALPWIAAVATVPNEFKAGFFAPLSPFTANPYLWLGIVLPSVLGVLLEEFFFRALLQPLLSRLFSSEWAGAIAVAIVFTIGHDPEQVLIVAPGALLFSIVFMHTRSVVCTSVLHLAMNVSIDLLTRSVYTLTVFLPKEVFATAQPLCGALFLLLAIGFDRCWRRLPQPRFPSHPPR